MTNLRIAKVRGRLEFVLDCDGRRVHAWMPIRKTKAVTAMMPGAQVDLFSDEAKPNRAIVRNLFES